MPRMSPSELTISVTTRPHPPRRFTRRRNALSVIPAIGASAKEEARLTVPIFMRLLAVGNDGGGLPLTRSGLRNQLVVGLLELLVLPLDDGLGAQARHELAYLLTLPVGVHPLRNDVANAVERLQR